MGFEKPKDISQYYVFRTVVSLLTAAAAGIMWTLFFLKQPGAHGWGDPLLWAVLFTVLLPLAVYWQQRLYRRHTRKVLFMLDAIENNDTTIHFSETDGTEDNRLVNRSLNRVARILHNVKSETAQREKYYELILDCVNTGIIVLNDNGAVYQKNNEALRLLGLEVFTHVRQLSRVDAHLTDTLTACRPGDKFQAAFGNERGTVNLSVRVSDITVRQEHLRILALNDINNELDEKEIDSWIRLTRVLTHEIMNAVTPITSLSDTLLKLTEARISRDAARSANNQYHRQRVARFRRILPQVYAHPHSRTVPVLPQRLHQPYGGTGAPSISRHPGYVQCFHRSRRFDTLCRRKPHFASHHKLTEKRHTGF